MEGESSLPHIGGAMGEPLEGSLPPKLLLRRGRAIYRGPLEVALEKIGMVSFFFKKKLTWSFCYFIPE